MGTQADLWPLRCWWVPAPGPEMLFLPVHCSHPRGGTSEPSNNNLKQRGRHLKAGRGEMSAVPVQTWKSNRRCPVMWEQLVILLTQVRESCAARLLGVEAGGSATVSPAQLAPPTNTGDPWETERPGHDSSFTALRPIPARAPLGPHRPFAIDLSCFRHFEEGCI